MASHFKTPDDGSVSGGTARHASVPSSGRGPAHVRPQHGGDESYHAPQANRHAASTPHSVSAHYIPVVSEPANGEKNKRDARFVETDPYDLSGRRSGDPKKRVGRIVSAVLFILGIALIVTAAGMWIYNQWQYHEQDVINEELATFADVSDDGQTSPQVDWEGLKAVNDDVVGWVQIPGTVVNFPVYQGETNDTYLRTSAEGARSSSTPRTRPREWSTRRASSTGTTCATAPCSSPSRT